jgi:hypothetical protein
MRTRRSRFRLVYPVAAVLLTLLLLSSPAFGQFGEATGSIFGKVVDEQGGALPGASVTIRGPGAPVTMFTDARGEFRALNLPPGAYTVTISLAGFSTVNRENVQVTIGRSADVTVPMRLSTVAATVTVTSEVPLLETRKVQTGAAVSQEELKSIPTARDPWVVMQSVAGVVMDRVNVAGSESGQQSNFTGKGASAGSFAVDGVNLTDMAALGASAGYYDFDMFQEMQIITGGSDPAIQGAGTAINMVTKRGTNDVHGSARIYAVDNHFEAENVPSEAEEQATPFGAGNHIETIQDYGAEAGGPIWKDHLWLWGSYGRSQINLVTAGGAQDRTTLENFNGKLNWQILPSNAFDVWYMRSDKLKAGRNAGPQHPQPTTWNQITPQNTWKFSDSHVFSPSLFATVQYNGANGNFELAPQGGLVPQTFIDEGGIWQNTYLFYAAPRPQRQVKGDISFFFNTGSAGHELKAGFGYLKATATSTTIWPGFPEDPDDYAFQTYGDLFDCSGDEVFPCATITRNGSYKALAEYYNGFIGDTVTFDRLTINAGLRYDKQSGENRPSNIPGNASFPDILPAINYPGRGNDFEWEDLSPRIGLTYALGSRRNTIVKASYARFAAALGIGTVGVTNPLAGASYAYYAWTDDGDGLVQAGEVDTSPAGFQFGRNFDPDNPAQITPVNDIDPDLEAPKTDEVIVGFDHELLPAFAIGVNYTYRKFTDFLFDYSSALSLGHILDPTTGRALTSDDYCFVENLTGDLPDGTSYSAPVYELCQSTRDRIGARAPAGDFVHNRDGYDQTYHGVEFVLTKRLANRWMARGSVTWNDHKQNHSVGSCIDPTNTISFSTTSAQSCRDDDYVSVRSGGSGAKDSVYLNSRWQFSINGMYQLPLGFNVAGSLWGREGYPINYWRRFIGPNDRLRRDVAVVPTDSQRYDDVFELDLRLEKVVRVLSTGALTLSFDVFNVTNENTVLQRFERLGLSNTNDIKEIQSPRIARFGARFSF